MKQPTLTYDLLMAASRDAGNASMRRAGRSTWNIDDWNAAAAVSDRLWAALPEVEPSAT